MRNVIQRIHLNPIYTKFYSWGKVITLTGSAQILVQAASLICGILVIRLLPTQEYALYTLANTMLGTMTILADGGISAGVMSIGGKVWQDPKKLGVVIATGLQLRRKFAIGSLLVAMPILGYLLLFHGATWITALLIMASLIPAFYAALSDSLLETAPKLHQDIKPLQKNQIFVGTSRLILSALSLFAFPYAFIAIIATGMPRTLGNIRLKKIAEKFAEKQLPNKEVRIEILKVVKRVLPSSIYYCFISQVSIWLISIFGNTSSIAEVGALGRLGVGISVFSVMINTLAVPRFARLHNESKIIVKRFFQILFLLLLTTTIIVCLTIFFPNQILFILGKQYSNLKTELVFSIIVSCLGLISSTIFSLSLSRGYILSPVINIGVHFIFQVILISFLNLSTTKNVLIFSILDYLVIIMMFIINFIYYISKMRMSK